MRICHLIYDDVANPWLAGGGAVRARELYRRLAPRHQVTLVSGRYPGAITDEQVDGLRILRVGAEGSYARSRLAYMGAACRQLRMLDWDVWVNEFSASAPLYVSADLRRRGVLLFQHFVGHHAIIKHPLAGPFAWLAERRALRRYSHIIAVSPSVQQHIQRLAGPRARVDCVHNGVDQRYFALQPREEPFVLYLGRTDVHTKGLDLLIAAFSRAATEVPELKLKLAGRGSPEQVARLHQLIQRARIGHRVEVLGGVSEAAKEELLATCLFVCMPSRYEGWGIVAIEAAAASKAALGTRIDGLQDAIRHGETGMLVEPDNVPALADQMKVLACDQERRRALGEAGRRWARRFDWDQLAQEHEMVCARVANLMTNEV
jgi:glycosyltransferase involved in cell wall biosynthesis